MPFVLSISLDVYRNAKLAPVRGAANLSAMPTASELNMLTRRGMAIGTVAYMSPEQVRGEELDTHPRTPAISLARQPVELASPLTVQGMSAAQKTVKLAELVGYERVANGVGWTFGPSPSHGFGEAAHAYFDKDVRDLSLREQSSASDLRTTSEPPLSRKAHEIASEENVGQIHEIEDAVDDAAACVSGLTKGELEEIERCHSEITKRDIGETLAEEEEAVAVEE